MSQKVREKTFWDMSLSTAGNIYKNRILIQPHPLCISRTRKGLFWVRANADDTSRAQKACLGYKPMPMMSAVPINAHFRHAPKLWTPSVPQKTGFRNGRYGTKQDYSSVSDSM